MTPQVQPLSYKHRNVFFYLLATAFFVSLPFLFLYATGYRINFSQSSLVSTGGLYVAAERTAAEIYINDELVRETRIFRRAFYSQGLDAGTHRVHVQKEGHHTWVKELPVYPHLVTEAQAFNLPIKPQVRVISPWQTTNNVAVLTSSSTILESSEVSNQYLFEPRASTSTLVANPEFISLIKLFVEEETESATSTTTTIDRARSAITSLTPINTTEVVATTTKEWRGVRLYESEGDVFATFIGQKTQMPYYYCAEDFAPYTPATSTNSALVATVKNTDIAFASEELDDLPLEVKTIPENAECDPTIRIDRAAEEIQYFDFFPNSTDLVLLSQPSGIYVVEIDDRAWQNRQPLLLEDNTEAIVSNGSIYIYDGKFIYQVIISQNWF